jgi:hypothetical protein
LLKGELEKEPKILKSRLENIRKGEDGKLRKF